MVPRARGATMIRMRWCYKCIFCYFEKPGRSFFLSPGAPGHGFAGYEYSLAGRKVYLKRGTQAVDVAQTYHCNQPSREERRRLRLDAEATAPASSR